MATTTIPGVSTLGVKFGYAVESVAGNKPAKFTQLERCNNIAGITLETEQIDASALEDLVTKYVAGRQDTGGTWEIVFNITNDVAEQLTTMMGTSQTARESGLMTWFEVWSPYLEKAFFVVAEPPKQIPMPEVAQNEVQTVSMTLTINEYKGMDTAIEPTTGETL